MNCYARMAGHTALMMFVVSAAMFGAMFGENFGNFSHRTHPLAWLGAGGVPRAMMFNLCTFLLPGVLAAVALWQLRSALPPDRRTARRAVGTRVCSTGSIAVGFGEPRWHGWRPARNGVDRLVACAQRWHIGAGFGAAKHLNDAPWFRCDHHLGRADDSDPRRVRTAVDAQRAGSAYGLPIVVCVGGVGRRQPATAASDRQR